MKTGFCTKNYTAKLIRVAVVSEEFAAGMKDLSDQFKASVVKNSDALMHVSLEAGDEVYDEICGEVDHIFLDSNQNIKYPPHIAKNYVIEKKDLFIYLIDKKVQKLKYIELENKEEMKLAKAIDVYANKYKKEIEFVVMDWVKQFLTRDDFNEKYSIV